MTTTIDKFSAAVNGGSAASLLRMEHLCMKDTWSEMLKEGFIGMKMLS